MMRLTSAEVRLKLGRANIKLFSRWNFRLTQKANESVLLKYLTNIIWHYLTCDQYLESDSKSIVTQELYKRTDWSIFCVSCIYFKQKKFLQGSGHTASLDLLYILAISFFFGSLKWIVNTGEFRRKQNLNCI